MSATPPAAAPSPSVSSEAYPVTGRTERGDSRGSPASSGPACGHTRRAFLVSLEVRTLLHQNRHALCCSAVDVQSGLKLAIKAFRRPKLFGDTEEWTTDQIPRAARRWSWETTAWSPCVSSFQTWRAVCLVFEWQPHGDLFERSRRRGADRVAARFYGACVSRPAHAHATAGATATSPENVLLGSDGCRCQTGRGGGVLERQRLPTYASTAHMSPEALRGNNDGVAQDGGPSASCSSRPARRLALRRGRPAQSFERRRCRAACAAAARGARADARPVRPAPSGGRRGGGRVEGCARTPGGTARLSRARAGRAAAAAAAWGERPRAAAPRGLASRAAAASPPPLPGAAAAAATGQAHVAQRQAEVTESRRARVRFGPHVELHIPWL